MTGLEPRADQAVRDAVDAFIEGRLSPEYSGETVFETKNSRYRLMDGILFSAPDTSLVGAELVGWLIESERHSTVESAWEATSRAVLVDRKRGRHIIVTSSTRMLHLEEESPASGSSEDQDGSSVHPPVREPSAAAPPPTLPPPPHHAQAPIHYPLAGQSSAAPPGSRPPLPLPMAPLPRVHAPPRQILQRIPQATAPTPLARPLPYPSAPPRRAWPSPLPAPAAAHMGPLPAPAPLPFRAPVALAHQPIETLDEGVEQVDYDDELEGTDPSAPPFLLARPAAKPKSIAPAAPASQPFPLARVMQRGAPLR